MGFPAWHGCLPYCHPPYQRLFVSYPGSHGGPVITDPCQCGTHHFGVCWLFDHYRYTILPNPLNGISGHLTGSGAQKRWKGVGGRGLGSATCDQEHCTHCTSWGEEYSDWLREEASGRLWQCWNTETCDQEHRAWSYPILSTSSWLFKCYSVCNFLCTDCAIPFRRKYVETQPEDLVPRTTTWVG